MTLGETRVRTQFNPSSSGIVDNVKQDTAKLIDILENERAAEGGAFVTGSPEHLKFQEKQRLISIAQTKYEEAAMFAVKALTA